MPDRVILDPGNPSGDDDWRPEVSLEHEGSELFVIVGEEAAGMAEGVSAESFEVIRARLAALPATDTEKT